MQRTLVIAVALAACGDGEDVPSCQDSVSHFYAAGCAFFETDGTMTTELEAIGACKELLAGLPGRCQGELADLRVCLASVPTPSDNAACGSCSGEQDAIIACASVAAPPPTAPTCRRDPSLDEQCRFAFENLNGFTCDPSAPLFGDGYRDCYLSGGLPGDPDFLMCCRDE